MPIVELSQYFQGLYAIYLESISQPAGMDQPIKMSSQFWRLHTVRHELEFSVEIDGILRRRNQEAGSAGGLSRRAANRISLSITTKDF